jgi:hypothetical protein
LKTIQRREIKKSFRADLTVSRKEQSDSERVKRLRESGRAKGFGESVAWKGRIR